jgi:hypothetical protein
MAMVQASAEEGCQEGWLKGRWFHIGLAIAGDRRYKISVQWWLRILKHRHSRQYNED